MNKYLKIYEILCPDDPIFEDDPRRPAIIAEMHDIHRAASEAEAVKVIEWWRAWPNPQHLTPQEFVQDARAMMRGETPVHFTKRRTTAEKAA